MRERAPKVGLFGLLGSGNIGNNASMDAMLAFMEAHHPDAILDAMCTGPEQLTIEYGIKSIPMLWYQKYEQRASGITAILLKVLGKGIDAFRTASWVRRHDVVIVPGMGVLEATIRLRPWGFPYALFLLSASGRIFGTKVALVCAGASPIKQRMTRWLSTSAARLAYYRSYRDHQSREAMRQRGLDVTRDNVYPDLAFALSTPTNDPGDPLAVGVGVMEYWGTNDDRTQAAALHASYVANMKRFVRWLADSGYRISLFVGDTNVDNQVVEEILTDLRMHRPDVRPARVVGTPGSSLSDLMLEMAPVGIVVATRYHNVLCALRLCKPSISIGYATKNDVLMANMGLAEFCQTARSIDIDRLIEQFKQLESNAAKLRLTMAERNAENARLVNEQFATLSATLFPEEQWPHARSQRGRTVRVQKRRSQWASRPTTRFSLIAARVIRWNSGTTRKTSGRPRT